jgi:hypothetical protein
MNKGIEILLERMKSNPEEFVPKYDGGTTKWGSFMQRYRAFLSEEDLEIFDAKHRETVFEYMQGEFTQAVMKELLDPKPSEDYWADSVMQTKGITSAGTWANTTATATINANSLTLGSTTLREEKLKQILEQHDLALKHKKRAIPR